MLAFALRRAIWAIPTLFGVSLVVFLLTTLLPDPVADAPIAAGDVAARVRLDELRRARFLDLPRLLNVAPRDVRSTVDECVAHVVAGDGDAAFCEERLGRLGGAALPHLLPRLDDIPPAARGRIAIALAPVARRMGIGDEAELTEPDRAALFWERFWEDRSVDFTEPAVHRSVQRITTRPSELLENDLRLVDTFALRELMDALRTTRDPAALARLTRIASQVTGRSGALEPDADRARTRAAVSEWLSWWYVHEADYVVLQGGEKVTASVAQTRYAKWVLGSVTGQLGLSTRDGLPIFDKLLARAPVTLGMALLALLVSALVGVPIGVVAAWRRGHAVDHGAAGIVLLVYSVPTFLVAELLATFGRGTGAGFVLPVLALSTVSLSVMTQQQRASMIEALGQDYVRAARAKGARTLRVALVHALRNALVPTVTIAGVQFPALVGGAFVVEEVFDIHGVGWETLRAIESHDVAWIVAVTLLCAIITTACLVASDIAYGLLDPRVRESQTRRSAA
ncbi:MAG: ABC transporter permease [Labilithrix sp.]|nr:ABC transporter permease [Labilithrix sp.]MBX3221972.1 ABC transporter permease [Labilithrix sp.]